MTKKQTSAIIEAINTGNLDYITKLLNNNTDWLFTRLRGSELGHDVLPIHYASRYGQLEIVKILLEKHPVLLNIRDTYRQTPVLWAAANSHKDLVNYLALAGADLSMATNAPNKKFHGYSPIHWAAAEGGDTVVQYLLHQGVNINMRLGAIQYHLIHIASINGHLKIVDILLNEDPDLLNITDSLGQTPLLQAAVNNRENLVNHFASVGANLTMATNAPGTKFHGYSPIHWAAAKGYYNIVVCLLEYGADINLQLSEVPDHFINIVNTKKQALELMKLRPELKSIFLQDDRVSCLINTTPTFFYKQPSNKLKPEETKTNELLEDNEIPEIPAYRIF